MKWVRRVVQISLLDIVIYLQISFQSLAQGDMVHLKCFHTKV